MGFNSLIQTTNQRNCQMKEFDSSNLTMKINGVEVSGFSDANEGKGFLSRNVVIKRSPLHMTELENKFIMMSRIAVALTRKGLLPSVYLRPNLCNIVIQCDKCYSVIEDLTSRDCTEAVLLS